jgi:hypothetical protein
LAAGIGMFMMVVKDVGVLIVFACALLPLLLVFRVFGAIRLRETFMAFRRNLAMAQESKEDRRDFEEMQLRLRQAKNFAQWWKAIRRAARELGFARLCVRLDQRDGTTLQLRWRLPSRELSTRETLTLHFPVRQRRLGVPSGRGEADVPVDGLLEGAGRRLSLFARLLDECGIDQLAPSPREPAPSTGPAAPDKPRIGSPDADCGLRVADCGIPSAMGKPDQMPRTVPASARKP